MYAQLPAEPLPRIVKQTATANLSGQDRERQYFLRSMWASELEIQTAGLKFIEN